MQKSEFTENLTRFIIIAAVILTVGLAAIQAFSLSFPDPSEYSAEPQTVSPGERATNERQPPDKIMDAIGLKPGMVVGEVGAGRGRFTVHLAARVGPTGYIYANDINKTVLAAIRDRCERDHITNIETILGRVDDPLFPKGALDMVFMILTYHHLAKPVDLFKNLVPSLKPGATVVIVDPDPIKDRDRRDGAESTTREEIEPVAAAAGFEIERVETFLPKDNIFVLRLKRSSFTNG